jgi:hypothetical protein
VEYFVGRQFQLDTVIINVTGSEMMMSGNADTESGSPELKLIVEPYDASPIVFPSLGKPRSPSGSIRMSTCTMAHCCPFSPFVLTIPYPCHHRRRCELLNFTSDMVYAKTEAVRERTAVLKTRIAPRSLRTPGARRGMRWTRTMWPFLANTTSIDGAEDRCVVCEHWSKYAVP